MTQALCHPARELVGHGLCESCYEQQEPRRTNRLRSNRLYYLRNKYNLSEEDYSNLLLKQAGVCAICRQPCSKNKNLSVDHNHDTGLVRGLLCDSCNNGIGRFKDDPNLLERAARYLRG